MLQKQVYFSLVAGIALGFTVAFVVLAPNTLYRPRNTYDLLQSHGDRNPESTEISRLDAHGHDHDDHDVHDEEDMERFAGPEQDVGDHDEGDTFHQMTNSKVADVLRDKVRVLCWIMTGPQNHQTKAKHVKATWGKRCNILLFMSSKEDEELPAIALPVKEGRNNLWGKTKEAFKHVYQHYFDKADWFMKADDDTYVIMENLRYMLYPTSPETPIYYGCRFKPYIKQGYMSGGAGYVLSREALRRPACQITQSAGGIMEDQKTSKWVSAWRNSKSRRGTPGTLRAEGDSSRSPHNTTSSPATSTPTFGTGSSSSTRRRRAWAAARTMPYLSITCNLI